jgi:acyl-coenzyme A thioesterase 13
MNLCRTANQSTVGKTLAYTSVHFVNKNDEIVARGSHTKFVAFAYKDEKNITSELKPEVSESKVT